MLLGGYDTGYEIYYKGYPIGRVNYELKEYELYHDGFITRQDLPMFLKAIDAVGFKNAYENENEDASEMVNEAKKQIMWAINFRNMSTAIHGLYYGKDRKRVEAFADEIEYIQNNDDWDWDEK